VAVLAGLAVGRFLTARAGPEVATSPAATSLVETIAILEDQVSVDPGDAGARQRLGIAYLQRAAEVGDPTLYTAAERVLGEAEELAPGDARTVTALGVLALARHDFDEALRLGLAAHADDPFSSDPLAVVVDAEVELGDYQAAANHLQQMLDLRPGLAALSRTSYLRELHGDLKGAIEAMEQARLAGSGSVFDLALVTACSRRETSPARRRRSPKQSGLHPISRWRRLGAPESNWPGETSTRPPTAYPIPLRASLLPRL
jgi:tetratricopeptide (TPR) repeat protein